jgi:hypothetical protein
MQPRLDAVITLGMPLIALDSTPFAIEAATTRLRMAFPGDWLARQRCRAVRSTVRQRGRVA